MVGLGERCRTILVTGCPRIKRVDAEIAVRLHEIGIQSVFFTSEGVLGVEDDRIMAIEAPKSWIARAYRFLKWVRSHQPDHLELYVGNPYIMLPYYAVIARLLAIPLVTWCRGSEVLEFRQRSLFRRLVTRFVFLCSDVLILKEKAMLEEVKRLNLVHGSNVLYLPNGVFVRKEKLQRRDADIILFLNSPLPMRHPEIIMQAIPSVLERVPSAKFLFVGARSALERNFLLDLAQEYGVESEIQIRDYTPDVQEYYETASIFVLPAERVFLNHSLLESMERGIPPIVADVDANVDEVVEHNVSGLVLPLDPDVWANAIVRLLKDRVLREKLGHAAREKVVQDFNMEKKIGQLEHLYERKVWHR